MDSPPFCPNSLCENHFHLNSPSWWSTFGFYMTKTFGLVTRFRCKSCHRTFSTQSFSIDYYAKKLVDYRDLLQRHSTSESVRGIGRALSCSSGTVTNRIDRLSRQALALHARLRPLATAYESITMDGFVSFDVSQFFPNEITLSITAASRFILDLSHATRRRSGTMSKVQRKRTEEIYPLVSFERGGITRTCREVLDSALSERPPSRNRPLVIITDEKKEYAQVLHRSIPWREQDGDHRVVHLRVNSKLPRTVQNPLFPSNYLDREIRKDQANHHRESTCFSRNVSNAMSRLVCYLVEHNYLKRYLIKAPVGDGRVHGEVAGIPRELIDRSLEEMFTRRAFLSLTRLPVNLERIWKKLYVTPLKAKADYLPAFALG